MTLDTPGALKQSLPGGTLIEAVFSWPPDHWDRVLRGLRQVTSVQKGHGPGCFLVRTENGSRTMAELVGLAARANVELTALSVKPTSLERIPMWPCCWKFGPVPQLNTLLFFPSGAVYPIHAFPPWLRLISRINPMTYAVRGFRAVVVKDANLLVVVPDILVLGAIGCLALVAGTRLFKRSF